MKSATTWLWLCSVAETLGIRRDICRGSHYDDLIRYRNLNVHSVTTRP